MSLETYLAGDDMSQYGINVISSLAIDKDDNLYVLSTKHQITHAGGDNDDVYKISDFKSIPDEYPYISSSQYVNSAVTFINKKGEDDGETGYRAGMISNGICITNDGGNNNINTMFISLGTATGLDNFARTAILNEPKFITESSSNAIYYAIPSVPEVGSSIYKNCLGNMISLPNTVNNEKMLLYLVPEYGVYTSIPISRNVTQPVISEESKKLISSDPIHNQYPISIAHDSVGNIYVGTTNITYGTDTNPRTTSQQSLSSYALTPNPIDPTTDIDKLTATLITTFEQPPLSVVESSNGNWTSITVSDEGIVYALYEVPLDYVTGLIQGYILQYTTGGKYVQLIRKLPIVESYKITSLSVSPDPPIPFTAPLFTLPISSLATDSKGRLYFTENYQFDTYSPRNYLLRYTPPSNSNICFPGKTPIVTDMGIVNIEDLDIEYHTIRDKKIVALTKTKSQENYLVCFEKNSLGEDCPSDKTIMSSEHKVLYKDKLVQAKKLLNHRGVKKVKYNGQTLYNVLLEDYSWIMVNDMVCETLHPENEIAKWYLSDLPELYKEKIITVMNYASSKKDYTSYKKAVSCLEF